MKRSALTIVSALVFSLSLSACGSESMSPDAQSLYNDLVALKGEKSFGCDGVLQNGVDRHADILEHEYPYMDDYDWDDVIDALSKFSSDCESGALEG